MRLKNVITIQLHGIFQEYILAIEGRLIFEITVSLAGEIKE